MNRCFRLASSKCFPFQLAAALGLLRLRTLLAVAAVFSFCMAAMAQSAHYGGLTGTVSSGAKAPVGVAMDGKGNLFVDDDLVSMVYKLQAVNGVLPSSPTEVVFADGFMQPYGLAVDAGGNVYVADNGHGAIKEIVAVNGEVSSSSDYQTAYSKASSWPRGIAVDSNGNLFFTDDGAQDAVFEIVAVNGQVSSSSTVKTLFKGSFSLALGIGVDAQNDVFIADNSTGTVSEIVAVNGAVSSGSALQTVVSNLAGPTGVALDAHGNLFVLEDGANDLIELAAGSWNLSATPSFRVVQGGFIDPTNLAVGLHGEIYVADAGTDNYQVKTISVDPPDFGSVNVGSTSATIQLPFTFDSETTLGDTFVSVLSQGASGQEFSRGQSSDPYCQANQTYETGDTCLIGVQFAPQHPGLRLGVAELLDANGNILASVPLAGTGVASQLSYLTFTAPTNIYSQINGQPTGVAVDSQGDVFYTDADQGTIFELVGGSGLPLSISSSFGCPDALAFDGGGNLFVADYCSRTVYEIQADSNGQLSANSNVIDLSSVVSSSNGFSGFSQPWGVAVDGVGNVFVTDANGTGVGMVYEIVADSTGHISGSSSVVQIATGFNQPQGLARDAKGDLFLADAHNLVVKEIVAVNGQVSASSQVVTVGSGFLFPTSVSVDAAGNVYVTDEDNTEANCTVKVILATNGAVSASSTVLTLTNGLILPWGITVDPSGNLFFTNQKYASVQELPFGTEPTQIAFNTTMAVGTLDATDDPQSLTLANIGNAARNFPSAVSILGADFIFDSATTCSQSGAYSLDPGNSCTLAIDFQPSASGPRSDTLTLGDSTLSAITLNGTGSTQPILSVPATLSMGNALAGVLSKAFLTVSNTGGAPLTIASITRASGASDFSVGAGGSCPIGLSFAANTSCSVEFDYSPAAGFAGAESAVFTITSDGGTKNFTISATSLISLTQPAIVVSSTTLDFGARTIGAEAWKWDQGIPFTQLTLTLTNEGAGTLQFSDLTTTLGVEDFYWPNERGNGPVGTCTSSALYGTTHLATGQSCTIQYNFLPWLNGARQGNLHIGSNSSVSPDLNVALKGVGVLPAGVVAVIPQQGASIRGGGKFATIDPTLHKVFAISGGHLTQVDTNTLAYNSLSMSGLGMVGPTQLALNAATGTIYGESEDGFYAINEATGTANFTSVANEYFYDIAVNPVANKAFLTDCGSNIGIVNGAAGNAYSAIHGSGATYMSCTSSLAVDTTRTLAYVLDNYSGKIAVVSGSTLQTPFITGLPTQGSLLTFNPVSNKLYTNGSNSTPLTVIDGATHAISNIAGIHATAVTVNPVTNRVYATNFPAVWSGWSQTATIAVIDGSTQAVLANVPVGQASGGAEAIAIDTVSNEIYVSNGDYNGYSNSVSVIDGATNTVSATVPTDYDPGAVVVDEANHHAFVLNERLLPQGNPTGSIFVIASPKDDGPTLAPAIAAAFGAATIAVNGTTSLNFTITNPNSSYTLSSVGFQAQLPSGLQAAAGTTAACGGALTTASNGSITVSGALIAPGGQCNVSLTVTGAAVGTYTISSGAVTAWPSLTGNTASAMLTVNDGVFTFSGTVTFGGQPLSGVTMSGLAGNPVTDSSGNYSAVMGNGSVYVTPTLAGYTFTPPRVETPNAPAISIVQNFTAVYTPPQVSTATTLGALSSTITSGGNVLTEGKFSVTARGVCWSKTVNPSTADSCTNDGAGAGTFASTITGLSLNTSYNVRAYATSSAGTAYGADMQFTTSQATGPFAYITGLNDNSLSVIDTATNTVSSTLAIAGGPRGVAVDAATGAIYVVQQNSYQNVNMNYAIATAIDAKTNSVAGTFNLFGDSPANAVANPDGSKIYVTEPDESVVDVIDAKTGAVSYIIAQPIPGKWGNFGLAVHPDGTRLYLTSEYTNVVLVVDLSSNTVTGKINVGALPRDVAINAAGTRAYVPNANDNTVSVIDVAAGSPTINTVLKAINVGHGPRGAALNQSGTRLYVTNQDDNTVSVIDTTNDGDAFIGTVAVGNGPYGIAMHPDGIHLYVIQRIDNTVSIIDTTDDRDVVTNTISVGQSPYQLGQFFWTRPSQSKATPAITWATPAAITYGTALDSTQLNATASYGGSPVPGTFAYSPAAGTVLNAGPNQSLSVAFTPTDTVGYNTATANVTLTVSQATPTVTWATPAAITWGTALSATQLDATANVPGTFTYYPQAGAYVNAGHQTLIVSFTPTDTTDYSTTTARVPLTVNQATATITWATPAAITYGTALGSTQLNATASFNGATIPGTFAYTPASGTVLNAGTNQTLSVTFTPADTTDYNTANGSVSLTVNKATPTVNWTAPSAITYGAALGSTQLNATATYNGSTVAGAFAYTPASGTVLSAGANQTLSVTFTPTDATDYTTANGSVNLTVNKATPTVNWTAPAAITYGAALSSAQLNATASYGGSTVVGTFAYTPASGTVLSAGANQTLSVTFMPTDTSDYNTANGSVSLTVNKAALLVSANNVNKSVGAANPTLTFSYSGFVNGESAALLSGSPSLSTTATISSPAGNYPITVSQGTLAAANYSFTLINGTLAVVAPPTVILTSNSVLSKVAGGYQARITITNSGTGTANGVQLNAATLGAATGSPLPQGPISIAAGGTGSFTATFPASAGADGASVAEKFAGVYSGGTFSLSLRAVTLP